jgi:hypothetical protein
MIIRNSLQVVIWNHIDILAWYNMVNNQTPCVIVCNHESNRWLRLHLQCNRLRLRLHCIWKWRLRLRLRLLRSCNRLQSITITDYDYPNPVQLCINQAWIAILFWVVKPECFKHQCIFPNMHQKACTMWLTGMVSPWLGWVILISYLFGFAWKVLRLWQILKTCDLVSTDVLTLVTKTKNMPEMKYMAGC